MESEPSLSVETSGSGGSSEAEDESLEPVHILGNSLELPQDLCEDFSIFKEFFSMKTWEALEPHHKEHLKAFLPTFPRYDAEEKKKTLEMLFNREPFHFTSPLNDFYSNLKQGNYRPDIANMRKFLMKARAKQQRHRIRSYYSRIMPEVLISRERLLAAARAAPPGPAPFLPPLPPKPQKGHYQSPHVRSRQRYFQELSAIRGEVGGEESDDDNYPEGPPSQSKKGKISDIQNGDHGVAGTLGLDPSRPHSLTHLKSILAAHRARRMRMEDHPELNTMGITLSDIKQRVALNGTKKIMFGHKPTESPVQKLKRVPKKEPHIQKQNKIPPDVKPVIRKSKEIESYDDMQYDSKSFIKIKKERPDSDSESSSFVDPVESPKSLKRKTPDGMEIKQEVMDGKCPTSTGQIGYMDPEIKAIKQEPLELSPTSHLGKQTGATLIQPVPIKLEDLDGIDMMALPVELVDDDDIDEKPVHQPSPILEPDESLKETTYANFLALVKALFPARQAHRASKKELYSRCTALMRSPIAPLNTWYSLSDDWCSELDSALEFLAGEKGPHPDDFVPYLQYIPESKMYQWIGAGRDCDAILARLCERWLRARAAPAPRSPAHTPSMPAVDIPPARYPTSWVVRPASNAELSEFRAQERRRFATAAKPFTYVQHGYRAVVGGCARAPAARAAHGALLIVERPRHASFMALVRDAVARLPNGEGTKQDVVTLLRMSQWIAPQSEQTLSSAVNAALERLNLAKRDPWVRSDSKTKLWVYAHRHRTEEDWERLSKPPPGSGRSRTPKVTHVKDPRPTTPAPAMEIEVGAVDEVSNAASDSDVDVDDSGKPPRVSPQLLPQPVHQPIPQVVKQMPLYQHQEKHTPIPPTSQAKSTTLLQANKISQHTPRISQRDTQSLPKSSSQVKPKPTQSQILQQIQAQQQKQQSQQQQLISTAIATTATTLPAKSSPLQQRSSLAKQRPLQHKAEIAQKTQVSQSQDQQQVLHHVTQQVLQHATQQVQHVTTQQAPIAQQQSKPTQAARSLLIRAPASSVSSSNTVTSAVVTVNTQVSTANARRGIVRVLSPATSSPGKSLISPRALMQQGTQNQPRKRTPAQTIVTTTTQNTAPISTTASNSPSIVSQVSTSLPTRTVQLGGRTVQLTNQTVQLPSGQTVQLSSGHTLQLSSLQLPTHSVRLPSGQTVQLASPQTVRSVSTTLVRNQSPRFQTAVPTAKQTGNPQTVQLASGQTVQLTGQSVQLAGQSVQLAGHSVKLPSGQNVQLSGQSVQLPSGQSVQLASQNVLSGSNVQTVQLSGQTVQLASGQTVQIGGQTVQLPSGQTIQLSSGQTVQLATGQARTAQVRPVTSTDKTSQPLVAKLLTNAQGQVLSLEGVVGGTRTIQLSGVRPQAQKTLQAVQSMGGMRVVQTASGTPGARVTRPLLLTSKPLHNIILQQQGEGSALRATSTGPVTPSQTIVLGSIGGQTVSTTTTSMAPVLKLQQVSPLQQVKLSQGLKIQQGGTSSAVTNLSAVRGVVMDGQQLKLVGGRHVLARLLRPAQPQ